MGYRGIIVGVTGQARAGKDTIAEYLAKKHRFVRIGLADPMKRFVQGLFDWSDEQVWGGQKEEPDRRYLQKEKVVGGVMHSKVEGIQAGDPLIQRIYLTPRFALQTLGTEWGRLCYRDIWIEYGLRVAKELLDGYSRYTPKEGLVVTEKDQGICPGVVFSDLRFQNEFDAVRKAGGVLCRVKRPSLEDSRVGIEGHASEEEQKRVPDSFFDVIFNNDKEGDLDHLFRQVEEDLDLTQWDRP